MFSSSTKAASGNVPAIPDPQFNYVTMLLHGDGTNGAQNNTFVDSSTNNFTITRNGNTTQGSYSPYGSNWSNYFSAGNYLSIASNATFNWGTGDGTMEWWFNAPLQSTNYPGLVGSANYSSSGSTNVRWDNKFGSANSKLFIYINGGGDPILVNTSTLTPNAWHHCAVVRASGVLYFYVDGVQNGSVTWSGTMNWSYGGFYIGKGFDVDGSQANFNGYISNVRNIKGTAIYTGSTYTVPTAPLTAVTNTQLLTCQSNRFIDNSSNAYTITTTGAPSVQRFNPFGTATAYSTSVIGGSAYFDGSGDSLVTPTSANLNIGTGAFQIDFWMYSLAVPAQYVGPFSANNAGGNGGIFFAYRSGNLDFTNNYDTAGVISAPYPAINQWHHIALVRNSSNVRSYYIDGVRVGTLSNSVDFNQTEITVGHVSWKGYISNFRTIVGSNVADPNSSTITIPTAPTTAVSNTQLLTNFTNGAIFDNAMMNDLETVGNAQISTSVKKFGTGSMAFDGSGDWLTMPYGPTQNFSTGSFTIEMWAYLNSLSASYYVPAGTWNSGTSDEWLIQIQNNGNIRFLTTAGSTFYSASITTATWYHIAIVRNGSTINIYVNGTSVGSYTCTNSLGSVSKTLYIGTQAGTWDWNGYIDDFRITNGYARYTANFTPPTAAFSNTGPI